MGDNQFEPYPWSLKQVVEQNFYEVPIYQRPYTWSTPEVNSLLDDIFSTYRSNTDQSRNCLFTGQLFLRKMGKGSDGVKEKYEVVDGQQRLTTFSMILIAIFPLLKKEGLRTRIRKSQTFVLFYGNTLKVKETITRMNV